MLAIARAMVSGEEKLLLVDEPTEGLSPENTAKTVDALEEAKEETSVLLVTGKLHMAEKLADRYVVMSQGMIQDKGDMDDFTQEMAEKYLGTAV